MCGICGIIGRHAKDDEIRAMLDAIVHRGPDDEGIFQDGDVFLGHRRLAILDISKDGHQPMVAGNCQIVFNGEIYNYIELRQELEDNGHKFKTKTDTEVLLRSYLEWGTDCFTRLRGMWAIAIYDQQTGKIILCRDRFGIKPLYYTIQNESLHFSSEIPGLLPHLQEIRPNDAVVMRFLMLGITELKNYTFFDGIIQVPGGCYLEYDLRTKGTNLKRYYDLGKAIENQDGHDYDKSYDEAVKIHLRSDVQVGCCLSGGLDSSTLAAAASKLYAEEKGESMHAITAKSEDVHNNETGYAEIVAKHCSLNWHLSYPKYDDFVNKHKKMLKMQAEPVGSPSVFLQYCVMQEAAKQGCKVMLDGQGGDETLLGYEPYYITYLWGLLKRGYYRKFYYMYKKISENSKLTFFSLLAYFFYFSFSSLRKAVLARRCSFVKKQYKDMFFSEELPATGTSGNLQKLQIQEICTGPLSSLLRYEDRNAMAWSLESRVPYVDHVLVEKAVSLSGHEKIKDGWTKYVLRKICEKILPPEIAWRKNKYGFEAPESIWLNNFLPQMQATANQSALLGKYLDNIPDLSKLSLKLRWRIYNLAVWEKQYLDLDLDVDMHEG